MSKIIIAIDDGHGMETPGKRTPIFPNSKTFMHENEFNSVTANYLKTELERCGFGTVMTAPIDVDTPLNIRVQTAIKARANFFISIHANALNGVWGDQQGLSVYYYPGSVEGQKAATIIHKYMTQGTPQKDRGVLTANFYVLRETPKTMPSVLLECAFMDNLNEAKLLLSDDFRRECAREACKGICEYFGVAYVPETHEMTYEEAISIVTKFTDTDINYWITKKNIDKYFEPLIIKFAKAIKGKQQREVM